MKQGSSFPWLGSNAHASVSNKSIDGLTEGTGAEDDDYEPMNCNNSSASTDIEYASEDVVRYEHKSYEDRDTEDINTPLTTAVTSSASTPLMAMRSSSRGSYGSSADSLNGESHGTAMSNESSRYYKKHNIPPPPNYNPLVRRLSSLPGSSSRENAIRFQVVLWHIGPVNVQLGCVPMQFRITLFWNDRKHDTESTSNGETSPHQRHLSSAWKMHGRQLACLEDIHEGRVRERVDVPPLSILNATDLAVMGSPEVSMIHKDTRLMK
jgi:hypothetical protein